MSAEQNPTVEACPACGTAIDVSEFEPLTKVTCPACQSPILVGQTLGEYDLLEVMGRGGMGVVYRALDRGLQRPLALKILRQAQAQNGVLAELEAEAAVTASINHPHVVKVFTTGTSGGRFYIAMELVDKGTLDDLIGLQGRVAEPQALEIAIQIAQGLRAAHQHGLIHRDVKPGNILFSDAHTAKIVDFGLAIMEEASKGSDEIWGTPYYVSPERLDQKPEDFHSDMYSLGATMFHALAGRPPFEAPDATMVALKHLKNQAVSLQAFAPWVSGPTAYVINKTLQKDPHDRYASYDELIEHLEYALNELTAAGARPAEKKRVILETDEDRKRWGYFTTAMIILALLLGVGAGAVFYFSANNKGPTAKSESTSVGANSEGAATYERARQLLLHDKPAEAADLFKGLADSPKAPEPFEQWCRLHEGLSQLAAGKPEAARAAFSALNVRPYVSTDANGPKLEAFFRKVAQLGSSGDPVPPETLKGQGLQSFEALELLVAGLKDWEMGRFEDGAALLREFKDATAEGSFAWVGEYHELADDYVSDFSDYRGAIALAKGAHSVPELQAAAATIRKVKGDLKHSGTRLGTTLEKAASDATAAADELLRKAAAQLAAERKSLGDAKAKALGLAKAWKMKEARGAVGAANLTDPELQREQRMLQRKLQWLAELKDLLLKKAKDATVNLPNAEKPELSGQVTKVDDNGLEITPAGADPVAKKWTELKPDWIIALLGPVEGETPQDRVNRAWHVGVYELFVGNKEEARKQLQSAAHDSPYWAENLPLLMPPKRVNLAKGKPITASDDGKNPPPNTAAPKAVDGDPATKWFSKEAGPKWLRVDLGKKVEVVRWLVRHGGSHGEGPDSDTADFSLQRSDDDKTYADVEVVKNNPLDVTDRSVPRFSARYVRMNIARPNRKPNNDPSARIYEWEVWGSEAGPDLVSDLFAPPVAVWVPNLPANDIGLAPTDPTGATTIDENSGVFTVRGGGADISKNADAFRFVHRGLQGDGQLIVRVEGVDRGNDGTKGGIMFRESLDPGARMVLLAASPVKGLTWQVRKDDKGMTADKRENEFAPPCWLRIVRAGNTFTASASRDGKDWKPIGSETVAMAPKTEIGLAATAHQPGALGALRAEVIVFGH